MAYCPIPDETALGTIGAGTVTLQPPTPTGEICDTSVTQTVSTGNEPISTDTTVAGPPGPPGPPGGLILMQDGEELGEIKKLNFIGCQQLVSITDERGDVESEAMAFAGKWDIDFLYCKHDVVLYDPPLPPAKKKFFGLIKSQPDPLPGAGDAWSCLQEHTADDGNAPGTEGGEEFWERITKIEASRINKKSKGLLDLLGGLFNWARNASLGDWFRALLIGAGLIWLGQRIIDEITDNGDENEDGESASSRYNGTLTFSGPFSQPSLREVVESLCGKVIPAGQYDVSRLSNSITCSLALQQVTSVRALLDQLSKLYLFDMVDSSGVLKFVPRDSAPVRVLSYDDMGFNPDGASESPVSYRRLQSIDLPRSIQLTYVAQDLDYNNYTQTTILPSFSEGQDISISVPVVLDHFTAKQLTEQILINAHLERQTFTFKTSYINAIDLEPGDIVTIPDGNVRIITMEEIEEGIIEFNACMAGFTGTPQPVVVGGVTIGFTASSYATSGQAPQIPAIPSNTVTNIGFSSALFVDPPVLGETDQTPRVFAAVHGYGAQGWPGAKVYKSVDGGNNFNEIATVSESATFGIVWNAINSGTTHVFDTSTVIQVQLKTGQLMSVTDGALFNGANTCMVGREVIQFGIATLVAPNTYNLTRLLRGRNGTEWAVTEHEPEELFVMLDDTLVEIPATIGERNKPFQFKIVTIGSDLTKVNAQTISIVGENTIPWAVTNLTAEKDADEDWIIDWFERPRFVNSIIDYQDAPQDPDFQGFLVAIYDNVNPEPLRTEYSFESRYIYTKEQQIEDFGSSPSSLKVTVHQVSKLYGGGRPTSLTV